jgi:hypothetical protein
VFCISHEIPEEIFPQNGTNRGQQEEKIGEYDFFKHFFIPKDFEDDNKRYNHDTEGYPFCYDEISSKEYHMKIGFLVIFKSFSRGMY